MDIVLLTNRLTPNSRIVLFSSASCNAKKKKEITNFFFLSESRKVKTGASGKLQYLPIKLLSISLIVHLWFLF